MHMPARCCFPLPDAIDDESGALLEPLGVALHAVDLAKLRVGSSVAILGAGPIGLMLLQVARLAGADPVFVTDPLAWRLEWAERLGGIPVAGDENVVCEVLRHTQGRGVDVAIEAAWAGESVSQAAEMSRLGGRLVVVGISGDDRLELKASTARRKGLTIVMSRRMKHVYPRAMALVQRGAVDLQGLVSHRYPLAYAVEAFRLNSAYEDRVCKVMVRSGS
jgi:L-iditol 2-dehydrogenase